MYDSIAVNGYDSIGLGLQGTSAKSYPVKNFTLKCDYSVDSKTTWADNKITTSSGTTWQDNSLTIATDTASCGLHIQDEYTWINGKTLREYIRESVQDIKEEQKKVEEAILFEDMMI